MVCGVAVIFFFKQKTAYEMRISDWSSDVCSSDLEDALDALASAAMGSPYHARLFGMSAALVTEAAARDRMLLSDVEQGLISALEDWEEMSGDRKSVG